MAQETTPDEPRSLVISYRELRMATGTIAIALPLLLIGGALIFEGSGLPGSISAYYHTVMRDVLVGCLWAIAVFMLSYRGYERRDDLAGDLASLFAIGTALFPSLPKREPTTTDQVVAVLHYLFAAGLFLTVAYFCLVLFRKSHGEPTPEKLKRNRVYKISGYVILGCIAGLLVVFVLPDDSPVHKADPIFWLEAIAIWAFGWSWFTKGEGIFKDGEPAVAAARG